MIHSNLLMGTRLRPADVACEGITGITHDQIRQARDEGKRYKLVGGALRRAASIEASVRPVCLPLDDPLAGVSGATNAITFDTDLLGRVTVVGPGAGRRATGFALLADLIEISRTRP